MSSVRGLVSVDVIVNVSMPVFPEVVGVASSADCSMDVICPSNPGVAISVDWGCASRSIRVN